MIKTVTMKFAGIEFEVDLDISEDNRIEQVMEVRLQDGTKVDCDTVEFCDVLEDQLYEALEEELLSDKLAAGDLMYETAKEEWRL